MARGGRIDRMNRAMGRIEKNGLIYRNRRVDGVVEPFGRCRTADANREPEDQQSLLVVRIFLLLLIVGVVLRLSGSLALALGGALLLLVGGDLTLVTLLVFRGQLLVLLLQVGCRSGERWAISK